MAPVARSMRLLSKAESAIIAAIEIYNKPDFAYREETFAILALNAWELLLKAKLLADIGNNPRSIYAYEKRRTKRGEWSNKIYLKRNRAGNVSTIGLTKVINLLDADPRTSLLPAVKTNLRGLVEIRDNAIHYMNPSPQLSKQVLEVGTASVKNFIELAQRWFNLDLSQYNLYLMPIGFVTAPGSATALRTSPHEGNLVSYLRSLVAEQESGDTSGFHVALEVNLSFKRSAADAVTTVEVTDDPNAVKVVLTEEDIRNKYPWDFRELTQRLRDRFVI